MLIIMVHECGGIEIEFYQDRCMLIIWFMNVVGIFLRGNVAMD